MVRRLEKKLAEVVALVNKALTEDRYPALAPVFRGFLEGVGGYKAVFKALRGAGGEEVRGATEQMRLAANALKPCADALALREDTNWYIVHLLSSLLFVLAYAPYNKSAFSQLAWEVDLAHRAITARLAGQEV
ncbi:hypothetical protein MN1_410 [Thermus phage MN1]|nr:hypothetical protein MN1_410 [Thermus phage MN1]